MSTGSLTHRNRSQSQAAIRKRLLRSNSEDRQKELAKTSTATSFRPKFERLIQEGKIEQILNTDPHSKANLFYTTHINEMQKQLGSTKKSLSTMVMKSKSKEYSINKLKNDIAKVEREQMLLRGDSQVNKNKYNEMSEKFNKKVNDVEEKSWEEKCYKQLKFKLTKDEDFLRARHDQRHNTVAGLKEERAILETQYYNLSQFNKKLQYNFNRAKEISKEQTDDKNEFIELLNMQMVQKDMINDLKIAKNHREGIINDLAPSVIEKEELQKYLQILFTHKVVSQIVKQKSQKLIEQYSEVQNAFLHIRSNTNISEMKKVLERMESQDKEYESLLTRVSRLEKELIGMDDKMNKAVKKEHELLSMDGALDSKRENYYQGIEKDNYEILLLEKEKLQQRKSEDEILKTKILMWVKEHSLIFGLDFKYENEEGFMEQLKNLAAAMDKKIKNS